jgi:hypothetical protein
MHELNHAISMVHPNYEQLVPLPMDRIFMSTSGQIARKAEMDYLDKRVKFPVTISWRYNDFCLKDVETMARHLCQAWRRTVCEAECAYEVFWHAVVKGEMARSGKLIE